MPARCAPWRRARRWAPARTPDAVLAAVTRADRRPARIQTGHTRCAGRASCVRRWARARRLGRRAPRRTAGYLQPAGRHQFRLEGPGMPGPVSSARGPHRGVGEPGGLRPPDGLGRRGRGEFCWLPRAGGAGGRPDRDANKRQQQQQRQHDHEPEQDLAVHGGMAHWRLLACWASLLGIAPRSRRQGTPGLGLYGLDGRYPGVAWSNWAVTDPAVSYGAQQPWRGASPAVPTTRSV